MYWLFGSLAVAAVFMRFFFLAQLRCPRCSGRLRISRFNKYDHWRFNRTGHHCGLVLRPELPGFLTDGGDNRLVWAAASLKMIPVLGFGLWMMITLISKINFGRLSHTNSFVPLLLLILIAGGFIFFLVSAVLVQKCTSCNYPNNRRFPKSKHCELCGSKLHRFDAL